MTTEGTPIEEYPRGGPCHNVPLGTLVLRAGLMPEERIEEALKDAVASGRKLGELLVDRGLEERELTRLLAAQHAQPFVDLTRFAIDWDTARLLPPAVALAHCALPIAADDVAVTVAVPDPNDERQRERLRQALQRHIRLVAAARGDIKDAIGAFAPRRRDAPAAAHEIRVSLVDGTNHVVASARTDDEARAAAERVVALARAGALIATDGAAIDGADVVAVDVVARRPTA